LPSLAAPKTKQLHDELMRYLSTDIEQVKDVLLWWAEHKATYPRLSRMALNYLTIPGRLSSNPYNAALTLFYSNFHRRRACI
jgi:hypothetical protein